MHTGRTEENLIFVVVSFAGDRGSGRPDTGRCGLDARGNEFQRIRQESISVALVVDETTVGLGAITLHNQIDGASGVVTGDRGATGSTIAKGIKGGGWRREVSRSRPIAGKPNRRSARRWRVGLFAAVVVVVVGVLTFNRDGSFWSGFVFSLYKNVFWTSPLSFSLLSPAWC